MVNGADASDACLQTFRQTDSSAFERGAFAEINGPNSFTRFPLSEEKFSSRKSTRSVIPQGASQVFWVPPPPVAGGWDFSWEFSAVRVVQGGGWNQRGVKFNYVIHRSWRLFCPLLASYFPSGHDLRDPRWYPSAVRTIRRCAAHELWPTARLRVAFRDVTAITVSLN